MKRNRIIPFFLFLFLVFGPVLSFCQDYPDIQVLVDSLKYEDAIDKIDILLKKDKKNPQLYFEKGNINYLISKREKSNYLQMKFRKRSEKAFKKALRYGKNDVDMQLRYGLVQKEREFFLEAEHAFKKVIKLDPGNPEAYRHLIDIYRTLKRARAIKNLKNDIEKIQKKSGSVLTNYALYFVYAFTDEWEKAKDILLETRKMDPSAALTCYYLSDVWFNLKNLKKFTENYYLFLTLVKKDREINYVCDDVKDIMSEEEYKRLKSLPKQKRGGYVLNFWKLKDVNPITSENERLAEHKMRLDFARTFYGRGKRGYDDRGRWYVKFGPPDEKYVDAAGRGAVFGMMRIIPPNESWVYRSVDNELTVDFMGNNFFLREVAIFPAEIRQIMYEKREHLGGDYYSLANHLGSQMGLLNNVISKRVRAKKRAEKLVDRFRPVVPYKPGLPFAIDVCRFKEGNKTRIEVYYGLFYNYLNIKPDPDDNMYKYDFMMTIAARDGNVVEVYRNKRSHQSKFLSKYETENSILLDQETFILDNGTASVYMEIVENIQKTGNILKVDVEKPDFNNSNLAISDIQFSSDITDKIGEGRFVKSGLKIMPFPFNIISGDKNVYTYFEIYNLSMNENNETDYEISYSLKKNDGSIVKKVVKSIAGFLVQNKEWSVSSSYNRRGTKRDNPEYLLFDFSTIDKGEYSLIVTVLDRISGTKASSVKQFKAADK